MQDVWVWRCTADVQAKMPLMKGIVQPDVQLADEHGQRHCAAWGAQRCCAAL